MLIGLRETSPREAHIIPKSQLKAFAVAGIDALGIREVIRQSLRIALAGARGFYVSYSPTVTDVPGTAFGSGGMTIRKRAKRWKPSRRPASANATACWQWR